MKLWRYIQGNRKGKEAHRIEKEAMSDPFLADALEGYEKIQGNHQREVAKLQKEIKRRQKSITNKSPGKKNNHLKAWSIAASILVVAGIGTWFLLDNPLMQKDRYAVKTGVEEESRSEVSPPLADLAPDSAKTTPGNSAIAQVKTTTPDKRETQIAERIIIIEDESAHAMEDATAALEQSVSVRPKETTADVMMRTTTDTSAGTAIDTTKANAEPSVTPTLQQTVQHESDNSKPYPTVGMEAYMGYIQRNLKRPTDDECRDVEGSVVVVFKIGQSGRPYNIKVTQGLCLSANKEAIRLIIDGPDWKKGSHSDEATITIKF